MNDTKTTFKCPRCGFEAKAIIRERYKFVIYVCPKCQSNVAHYKNKLSIVSDRLVNSLVKTKRFKCCGELSFESKEKAPAGPGLTKDAITDLKILLETSKDVNTFLKKL
jgi:hypothetical protein